MSISFVLFATQSPYRAFPDSPSSKDGQPVPGNPDNPPRPQSHASGGLTDAADAGYILDYSLKTGKWQKLPSLKNLRPHFYRWYKNSKTSLMLSLCSGNMRGFGMGGQQFRQFFAAGARSSLLGPVPMGMAIKSPMMGYPAARSFHPHARYYNNNSNTATITTTAPSTASSSSSSITTVIKTAPL